MSGRRIVTGAAVSGSLIFALAPFLYMIYTALIPSPSLPWSRIPLQFTTEHLYSVLTDPALRFPDYLLNSLLISLISAVVSVALSSLAAYGITRIAGSGRRLFLSTVLVASLFPPVSLAGTLFRMLEGLGWINTYGALIVPYIAWTIPLSLWILVGYFSGLPRDLDSAALLDGCSRLCILFRITLPLAMPGIISTLLLAFVFAFNEFLFALLFTTDVRARTIPVGIALFEGLYGKIPWGEIMAAAVVATLPVVLLVLFFQKWVVRGLTRGAVKE